MAKLSFSSESNAETLKGFYIRLKALLCIFSAGVLNAYSIKYLANQNNTWIWLCDLLVHWQWLFVAGIFISSILLSFNNRNYLYALLLIPLPIFSASPILPSNQQASKHILTIASANVHLDNSDIRPLKSWLNTIQPDVVVILEISPAFAKNLSSFASYQYQVLQPEYSPFGIALLSKFPIRDSQIIKDAESIAHIEAAIDMNGQSISVIAFHPMPPLSDKYHQQRNQKLKLLAEKYQYMPAIILGDFNATPWSVAFVGMAEMGWRRASGISPTWPAIGRGFIGIPIDHVLASKHWMLEEQLIGANIQSDHLPIAVRLSL